MLEEGRYGCFVVVANRAEHRNLVWCRAQTSLVNLASENSAGYLKDFETNFLFKITKPYSSTFNFSNLIN